MGYMICSISSCRKIAHGAHDGNGRNLCKTCNEAYQQGVYHVRLEAQGFKFTYKLGGDTWEKAQ